MKKILIPFSSGLDSTYLTYETLKRGNYVALPYFEITNNAPKVKIENIHRGLLIKELKKEFPKINDVYNGINDLGTVCSFGVGHSGCIGEFTLVQPPIWIMGINFIDSTLYDEAHISYVMEDHALSYLNEIKNLNKAYLPFKHKESQKGDRVKFPIIKTHKGEIVGLLPKNLSMLTWSCENPQILFESNKYLIYTACGGTCGCQACKHRESLGSGNIWKDKYYIYYKPICSFGGSSQLEKLDIVNSFKLEEFLKFNSKRNKVMSELSVGITRQNEGKAISVDCPDFDMVMAEEAKKEDVKVRVRKKLTKIKDHGASKRVVSKPKRKRSTAR